MSDPKVADGVPVKDEVPIIREGESVKASMFVPVGPASDQKAESVLMEICVTKDGRLRITSQRGVLFVRPMGKDSVDIYPRVYLGKGAQL